MSDDRQIKLVDVKNEISLIERANFGATVRSSIISALQTIAKYFDQELTVLDNHIITANSNALTAQTDQQSYNDKAEALKESIGELETLIESVKSQLELVRSVPGEQTSYTPNYIGKDPEGNEVYSWSLSSDNSPHVSSSRNNQGEVVWTFYSPGVPQFNTIVVKRLNWADYQNRPSSFVDSVRYDLPNGTLYVTIADQMSKMMVRAQTMTPSANTSELLQPKITYETINDVVRPILNVYLPRGERGYGTTAQNFRAFVAPNIWTNDLYKVKLNANDSASYYFGEEVILNCNGLTNHKRFVSGQALIEDYCLLSSATPAFDAVIVTFQKSIPNTDAANYKIANTNNSGQTIDKNWDWSNQISVIVPRGTQQTVTMVDAAGRIFTRTVYWLDEPVYRVCVGGAKGTWPTSMLLRRSESGSAYIAKRFPANETGGGLLFSHTRMLGANNSVSGDAIEWAWAAENSYINTKNSSKGFKDPSGNININKTYDQFLIPMSVTGILYKMADSDYPAFGITISDAV